MTWALRLVAVVCIAFGVAFFALPELVGWAGLLALGPEGRGEVRAVYGGLLLVLGIVILEGLRRPDRRAWLEVAALVFGGLAAGRVAGLLHDGVASYTVGALLFEGCTAVLLLLAARRG